MSHDAYILIGGRSSRMGRDKALVEVGGSSLAATTLATLRSANLFAKIAFVAAHEAQFAIPAVALGAPFIFDIYLGRGPLSGVHTALAEAKTDWIFVTACDYPFTTPELISLLASRISTDHGAVVPEQPDGRLQPLFAFYRTQAARMIVNRYVEGDKHAPPMRELVERLDPVVVLPDEYSHLSNYRRLFHNVNTPDDLKV
jgi:molybdopterin-guanine dinucleotide biosynthesis protein A